MELLTLSDLHSSFPPVDALPDARAVLVAGDLTNQGIHFPVGMRAAEAFLAALIERYGDVFWIPGNHDIGVKAIHWPGVCLLEGPAQIDGLTVAGIALAPCFDMPRLADYWDHMTPNPAVDAAAFAALPPAQIVVSHSPPLGALDSVRRRNIGSPGLRDYIRQYEPALVVCGHCHEGLGEARIGATLVVNTAQAWTRVALEGGVARVADSGGWDVSDW